MISLSQGTNNNDLVLTAALLCNYYYSSWVFFFFFPAKRRKKVAEVKAEVQTQTAWVGIPALSLTSCVIVVLLFGGTGV
jgi:hypothetical protein